MKTTDCDTQPRLQERFKWLLIVSSCQLLTAVPNHFYPSFKFYTILQNTENMYQFQFCFAFAQMYGYIQGKMLGMHEHFSPPHLTAFLILNRHPDSNKMFYIIMQFSKTIYSTSFLTRLPNPSTTCVPFQHQLALLRILGAENGKSQGWRKCFISLGKEKVTRLG